MHDATERVEFCPGTSPKSGFGVGQRMFLLLAGGFAFVPLIFLNSHFVWLLLGWNVLVFFLFFSELRSLPRPAELGMRRSFEKTFEQLQANQVTLHLQNSSVCPLFVSVEDDVPESLSGEPVRLDMEVAARLESSEGYSVISRRRGMAGFGKLYARYETGLRLAQRWAVFDVAQSVRVLPDLTGNRQRSAFLMRSRQIQLEQRATILLGHGREFESLKEFQAGDEMRSICWTATARRGKLVSTQRRVERSQTIWTVVDCGRLMRARIGERSKLDYAVEALMTLAQVSDYGGDSSAMLAYGQRIQQRRLPGRGMPHLNSMLQQVALVQEEAAEADHMMAVSSLLMLQKSRAMIVWITDLADLAITPEVVSAALMAAKRHLFVLAVIGQPDVTRLLAEEPADADSAFLYAAASELTARRELALAQLRSRGVRAVEISAPHLSAAVLNQYLEVKQKNLL